jgi:hypothetical protein
VTTPDDDGPVARAIAGLSPATAATFVGELRAYFVAIDADPRRQQASGTAVDDAARAWAIAALGAPRSFQRDVFHQANARLAADPHDPIAQAWGRFFFDIAARTP